MSLARRYRRKLLKKKKGGGGSFHTAFILRNRVRGNFLPPFIHPQNQSKETAFLPSFILIIRVKVNSFLPPFILRVWVKVDFLPPSIHPQSQRQNKLPSSIHPDVILYSLQEVKTQELTTPSITPPPHPIESSVDTALGCYWISLIFHAICPTQAWTPQLIFDVESLK